MYASGGKTVASVLYEMAQKARLKPIHPVLPTLLAELFGQLRRKIRPLREKIRNNFTSWRNLGFRNTVFVIFVCASGKILIFLLVGPILIELCHISLEVGSQVSWVNGVLHGGDKTDVKEACHSLLPCLHPADERLFLDDEVEIHFPETQKLIWGSIKHRISDTDLQKCF